LGLNTAAAKWPPLESSTTQGPVARRSASSAAASAPGAPAAAAAGSSARHTAKCRPSARRAAQGKPHVWRKGSTTALAAAMPQDLDVQSPASHWEEGADSVFQHTGLGALY